ncbi:MAG: hypothetical protein K2H97_01395 [Prevotella sp.]|nr:hypothetical protein [Prevotella sp.]
MAKTKRKRVRPYHSLEEILMRKEQLDEVIELENQEIKRLWGQLTANDEDLSRGQQIGKYIEYGIIAFDGVMTLRKLKRNYGSLLNIFRR